jgi:hypothetical protein
MKIVARELIYLLYGLAFGFALVPGLSWVTRELLAFTDPTVTNEPALAYYLAYYRGLEDPVTWLWFLAPYFLFLFARTFIMSGGEEPPAPLDLAACEGETSTIKVLIDEGADVNAKDAAGQTPLHLAAIKENSDVVKLLIDGGADIDSSEPRLGFRPLHNAALEGNLGISELLVKYGADLDAQTLHGDTALHLAAIGGHADIVALLLQYRANMDIVDAEGRTAMQRAIENGHEDVIDQFRQHNSRAWPYLRLANT